MYFLANFLTNGVRLVAKMTFAIIILSSRFLDRLCPNHTPRPPLPSPNTTTSVTNASSGAIGRYTIILYKTRHAHIIYDISKD